MCTCYIWACAVDTLRRTICLASYYFHHSWRAACQYYFTAVLLRLGTNCWHGGTMCVYDAIAVTVTWLHRIAFR